MSERKTSCLLWPFQLIADLLTWVVTLTGRLVAVILGVVLVIVGIILTVLVITAPVGIPLLLFGILLMVRSLW